MQVFFIGYNIKTTFCSGGIALYEGDPRFGDGTSGLIMFTVQGMRYPSKNVATMAGEWKTVIRHKWLKSYVKVGLLKCDQ